MNVACPLPLPTEIQARVARGAHGARGAQVAPGAMGRRPASPEAGFSFIEVIIALSILLVGSVSILSLFSIGVFHQTERRIEQRVLQVTPEITTIVQEELDKIPPGRMPTAVKARVLSVRGYTVDVKWTANPLVDQQFVAGVMAHAILRYRGNAVRTLKPIPVTRSTLDPRQPESPR